MMNVSGSPCLIVGGGRVAERKVQSLQQAGANVTVVSPEFTEALIELASSTDVVLIRQPFDAAILTDEESERFALVIAASNQAQVNRAVAQASKACGILVNVVDQPEISSFILPSVVRRGKLVITVSTGGASPSAARKIAKEIDNAYGDEYEIYLDFLSETRLLIQNHVKDKQARQRLFKEMLAWDVMGLIRKGVFDSWRERFNLELQAAPWMVSQDEDELVSPSWSFMNEIGLYI
ncbi:precorrin-2 dehydrogenase/sirohydrochlorin ferrochelatase family protein [Paenibacillus roseipurpureus]|uniref:precorrin-2 dehydrogenase n=1 Tax=Paenibacillus roseopurpureus TaxID=2918901 RepID=A0AA96LTP7_9BACL|nr:bifunctional precorrin-2 dehydrogenase/sirohydrochlorin ferrochelatase [Paenibacillus sp. MBLB1832]WNR45823.1 bifunctional precorrin-2 dehydrogenase/sirohydrochlorin ferrochelatase [Paenibacillus sp. MBLB1832]